jgi:hypothetical protein
LSSLAQAAPKASASPKRSSRVDKALANIEQPAAPEPRPLEESLSGNTPFEALERVVRPIRPGDTPAKLLASRGLSRPERQGWLRSIQKQVTPKRFSAAREIHFYFKRAPAKNEGAGK